MRIPVRELKENHIVEKDILGKTGKPIVRKETVLTDEHIRFIHAFLVEHVHILPKTADGSVFELFNTNRQELNEHAPKPAIGMLYEDTVSFIMTQFKRLEQKNPIDMLAIRQQIVPLFDRVEEEKKFLHSIHLRGTSVSFT